MSEAGKATLGRVLTLLRGHEEPEPYYRKLETLLGIPDPAVTFAIDLSGARALYGIEGYDPHREERLAADPARRWTRRIPPQYGRPGESFRVDARDLDEMVVQIEVFVDAAAEDLDKLRFLEDAIEKHLAIEGFTVDLVLRDAPTPGAFRVQVDRSRWPDARNWHGTYQILAHELMHLFGLPDEYDLTSHYDNESMTREVRLYWFEQGLRRGPPPPDARQGIMAVSSNKPLRRHALAVVGRGP